MPDSPHLEGEGDGGAPVTSLPISLPPPGQKKERRSTSPIPHPVLVAFGLLQLVLQMPQLLFQPWRNRGLGLRQPQGQLLKRAMRGAQLGEAHETR